MTPHVITAKDAIAQGSTWAQIASIAGFHEKTLKFIKPKNFDRLPRHKQEAINLQARFHQKAVDEIRATADEMRLVQEGVGLNG